MVISFSISGKAQVFPRQVFNQSAYCIASSQRKPRSRLKVFLYYRGPIQFTDTLSGSQINCFSPVPAQGKAGALAF